MGDFSGYSDYFKFFFIYTWTSQTFLYRFGFSLQTWSSTIPNIIGVIYATRTIDAVRILKYLEENYTNVKLFANRLCYSFMRPGIMYFVWQRGFELEPSPSCVGAVTKE